MMTTTYITKRVRIAAITLLVLITAMAGMSSAITVNLRADTTEVTMPDGKVVTMWGFAEDSGFGVEDGTVMVPGPAIDVPPGDTLSIVLDNNLPEPVSIVIPGQLEDGGMAPVWNAGKVRSFTHETAPGNTVAGSTNTYTWSNLRPGTYLYQSGSHPAVQIQMGLYGMAKKDAAVGQAYPGIAFDSEIAVLYSEIDSDLHKAVASGNYGPGTPMTSTIDYNPEYFLVNGIPYSAAAIPLNVDAVNGGVVVNNTDTVLIRFLNAGLMSHNPIINGYNVSVIAEDGYAYNNAHSQYSVDLPAGKTKDTLLFDPSTGNIPIYDMAMHLANGSGSPGGLLAYLNVSSAPFASSDISSVDFGTSSGVIQPVTISNTGTAATAIPAFPSGIFLWGSDAGDFTISGDTCSGASILFPGACGFSVSFTPAAANVGFRKANVGIAFDPGSMLGPLTIPVEASVMGLGVYRPGGGRWRLDINGDRKWTGAPGDAHGGPFGISTDVAVVGDWNEDGTTEIGVFRPSNGWFILDQNGNGRWDGMTIDRLHIFGVSGDIPLAGDWNGDGTINIGVYRPSTNSFLLDYNGNGRWDGAPGDRLYIFGIAGDLPVVGDWNGDGATEVGVSRPANGWFLLDLNANGQWDGPPSDRRSYFGSSGDIPVAGDWNYDGTTDIGVYRPSMGWFILDQNGNGLWDGGIDEVHYFGNSTDQPVVGVW